MDWTVGWVKLKFLLMLYFRVNFITHKNKTLSLGMFYPRNFSISPDFAIVEELANFMGLSHFSELKITQIKNMTLGGIAPLVTYPPLTIN